MLAFVDWLIVQNTATLLGLLEHAEYFNAQNYNPVFDAELEKFSQSHHDPEVQKQIKALQGFNWGGYLAGSLIKSGFRNDDMQEQFHNIVVKLLLSPGRLFKGWNPAKHGPLEKRFKRSVWNAILNAQEKTRNGRRWVTATDPTIISQKYPGRQSPSTGVLDNFRKLVADKLGILAVAIFDQRLEGKDTKSLVGQVELESPTVWHIKREVQAVKKLAQEFGATLDDPAFSNMVSAAMDREARTVAKRKQAVAASRPRG